MKISSIWKDGIHARDDARKHQNNVWINACLAACRWSGVTAMLKSEPARMTLKQSDWNIYSPFMFIAITQQKNHNAQNGQCGCKKKQRKYVYI